MSGTQHLLETLLCVSPACPKPCSASLQNLPRAHFIGGVSNILLKTKLVPGAYFAEVAIGRSVARARDK